MPEIIAQRSLTEIEADIRAHSQYVTASIIAIGKALIEAKAQLPHGEWESWVEGRVCFSQRTANNFMRIAREIDPGSPIAALPYTKALALLDAPAEQREQVATEIDATSRSAEAIRKALRDRNKEAKGREEAERDRDRYKKAAETAEHKAADAVTSRERASKLSEQYSEALIAAQAALKAAQERPMPTVTVEVAPRDYEAAKAAAAQAEALRVRAEQAEEYAIQMEQAAKTAQANARRAEAAHGAQPDGEPYSAHKMAEAVRAFMAAMGTVPNMRAWFFALPAAKIAEYQPYLAAMRAWVEGAEEAINRPEAIKAEAVEEYQP